MVDSSYSWHSDILDLALMLPLSFPPFHFSQSPVFWNLFFFFPRKIETVLNIEAPWKTFLPRNVGLIGQGSYLALHQRSFKQGWNTPQIYSWWVWLVPRPHLSKVPLIFFSPYGSSSHIFTDWPRSLCRHLEMLWKVLWDELVKGIAHQPLIKNFPWVLAWMLPCSHLKQWDLEHLHLPS